MRLLSFPWDKRTSGLFLVLIFVLLIVLQYFVHILFDQAICVFDDDVSLIQNSIPREYTSSVICINNLPYGGSKQYLSDLELLLPDIKFIEVKDKATLKRLSLNSHSTVLVNHLILSDIDVNDILAIKRKTKAKVIVIVHDFFYMALTNPRQHIQLGTYLPVPALHGGYLNTSNKVILEVCEMMQIVDVVIHQSEFSKENFDRQCKSSKAVAVFPSDFPYSRPEVNYRPIYKKTIILGAMIGNSVYKGIELVTALKEMYRSYRGYRIQFKRSEVDIPPYGRELESFIRVVQQQNFSALLFPSRYGETYSFALTKYLHSQLPIVVNNFGAFKERLQNESGIFPLFDHEDQFELFLQEMKKKNINGRDNKSMNSASTFLRQRFETFLDELIQRSTANSEKGIQAPRIVSFPKIEIQPFYEQLLLPYYQKQNLFLITNPLYYQESAFLNASLVQQQVDNAIKTIKSIRAFSSSSYIILIDGNTYPAIPSRVLKKAVDVFINPVRSAAKIKSSIINSLDKDYIENAQLLLLYRSLLQYMTLKWFRNVFKISSGTVLTPAFNQSYYDQHASMIFKKKKETGKKKGLAYFSSFYKIEPSFLHDFFYRMKLVLLSKEIFEKTNVSISFEEQIPVLMSFNFTEVKTLGIRQISIIDKSKSIEI